MRERLAAERRDTFALYVACRDQRVGWPAKALGAVVIAYALSPVDLVPDFIPVLGYLDDVVLIPLGVMAVRKLMPAAIFEEHRAVASRRLAKAGRGRWVAAAVIVGIWLLVAALVAWVLFT